MVATSDPQLSHILSAVEYMYLPVRGCYTGDLHLHARGSKHMGGGNQFMGMIELPEGAIVELKLRIDKKPTNMRSKVLRGG